MKYRSKRTRQKTYTQKVSFGLLVVVVVVCCDDESPDGTAAPLCNNTNRNHHSFKHVTLPNRSSFDALSSICG